MHKLITRIPPLALLCFTATLQTAQAADTAVNRLLASQCAQCHGTNGHAVGDFESIAGEEAKDLYEDLMDMRNEDRPENIMDHQALGYTEDQIRRIAAFYATTSENSGSNSGGSNNSDTTEHDSEKEHKRKKSERSKRSTNRESRHSD